jgi:putative hemolysin
MRHADTHHDPALAVQLARSEDEIREAQALRYRVFAEELGARLGPDANGLDADDFDPHCDHLIVRDLRRDRVIGTYRILPAARARAAGGFYAEREFHLTRILSLGGGLVEVGRACVDPSYRTGGVISLLWSGLLRYLTTGGHRHVIGCASIGLDDGGPAVAALCRRLRREHSSPPEWRVFPRRPLPAHRAPTDEAPVPPLLKGYLRLGAYVCGDPAWDPAFGTADLLVLLPMDRLSQRHASRLLRAA